MRKFIFALAAASAAAAVTYRYAVRPWWKSWGVTPAEATSALTGDDVIANANAGETRAITIDAPPVAVWPWLMQMGFGRGGWYSYDAMDMQGASSFKIVPELQDLNVGDLVPTFPGGGFVVSRLEPNRALVLYLDTDLVREQAEAAKAAGLPIEVLNYTVNIDTANGRTRAAAVTLDRLAVGGLTERSVPALVAQPGQLKNNLLGMSFLNRLQSWEVRGDRLRLRGVP